ncbi:aldehyde ferredoxin oxidoreductase family protein [Desulfovibrio sp. UCD-KL4C]|uniref:aldehyde ferredoxin oxidoreductase family protein n=1 Tax=Desulfovibrio sp. UCD-KL4C TaxID=2578120 RepID=UPI0025C348E3|nr:aldehyde ferredoxin oxidoreductase C-terminal domain-containing protein [Desulfovibrio sp. UCD-KL4C]
MPRILRINTRTKEFIFEELGEYAGLGGRALTSRLVNKEVPADCHPLSSSNKLVFAAGILANTGAANSGRLSCGAKSPLTGGIKESNTGGQFAQVLPRLDLLAIVFEDKPAQDALFSIIEIYADKVVFKDATAIVGKDNYPAHADLKKIYGEKVVTALAGPAGEQCLAASTIQFSDPHLNPARSAGRGGMGAVMGSKKIKAIVLDPAVSGRVTAVDLEKFKVARKRWTEILIGHPVTGEGLPAYGTSILVNIINEAGALPTKNFRTGRFDDVADISGEKIAEIIESRNGKTKEGCHTGCVIQCSQRYNDKNGDYLTSGFEYETVWGFGANCLVKDIDVIATMDRVCDEKGIDTIEMGCTMAVAMDGGILEWGDGDAALALLKKVGSTDPMGRIIGNGTVFAGKAFGVDRIPTVKGQALPAYDPRSVKGIGVTYATTPMGGDHTAGYAVATNILKIGGDVDPLSREGQIELSKNLQIATASIDALGLCLFVAFAVLDTEDAVQCICDLVAASHGIEFTADDFIALGVNTLKNELEFNANAGFTKFDDQLPRFFSEENLEPHDTIWDYSVEELQAAKV